MSGSAQSVIADGYAALRAGDSGTARRLFQSASVNAERGETLEGIARADYLDHEYLPAIQLWGSAYEAYRREGDGVGAIRVARTLAYMHMSIIGDRAVMQGWFARAVSLLADEGPVPRDRVGHPQQGHVRVRPSSKGAPLPRSPQACSPSR